MPNTGKFKGVPFLAVGNDELGDPVGKTEICPGCKKKHRVRMLGGIGGLAVLQCGKKSYLVGIKGKKIRT
jgi:hypothetical protein